MRTSHVLIAASILVALPSVCLASTVQVPEPSVTAFIASGVITGVTALVHAVRKRSRHNRGR